MAKLQDIMVPVDFSPTSRNAIDFAKSLLGGEGEILLLHIVDQPFIQQAADEGLTTEEDLTDKLRGRAEARLKELAESHRDTKLVVKPLVVVGRPFVEIIRICRDLAFQAIVMGTHGRFVKDPEHALFGSTAEHVLRGARVPVVTVPIGS